MENDNLILQCENCGTRNRVPRNRLNDQAKCGKCGTPLPLIIHKPVNVSDQTFDQEVLGAAGPVLVDCWAAWCGPCRSVAPILDQLAVEYAGRIKIAKLNIDENPQIAGRYAIRSIPTLLLFNNGRRINTLVGALPKHEIEQYLRSALG